MRVCNTRLILLCYLHLLVTLISGVELPTRGSEEDVNRYREFAFGLLCVTIFIASAFLIWSAREMIFYVIDKLRFLLPSKSESSFASQPDENQWEIQNSTSDEAVKEHSSNANRHASRDNSETFLASNDSSQADNMEKIPPAAETYAEVEPNISDVTKGPRAARNSSIDDSDNEEVEFAASNYAQVEYAEMISYRTAGKSTKPKDKEEIHYKRDSSSDNEEVEFAASNYAQVEYAEMIPHRTMGKSSKTRNEEAFSTSNYAKIGQDDMINPYSEMHPYRAPRKSSKREKGQEIDSSVLSIYAQVEQDGMCGNSSAEGAQPNDEYAEIDRSNKQPQVGRVRYPSWLLEDNDDDGDDNYLPDLPAAYGTVTRNHKSTTKR